MPKSPAVPGREFGLAKPSASIGDGRQRQAASLGHWRPVPLLLNAWRSNMACGIQHLGPRGPNRVRMAAIMLPRRTSAAASIALILMISIVGALLSTRPPSPLAAAERLAAAVA